jgi:hypothetical protein
MFVNKIFAQYNSILWGLPKNATYLSIAGDYTFLSYNYERIFYLNRQLFLSGKVGIGVSAEEFEINISFGTHNEDFFVIPHHLTFNAGIKGHNLEIGPGGAYLIGMKDKYVDSQNHKFYAPFAIIGYRFQPYFHDVNMIIRVYTCFPYRHEIKSSGYKFNASPLGLSLGLCF